MNSNDKTRLLLFGDSLVVLKALKQYIAIVPGLEHCEVIGLVEYGSPTLLTQDILKAADFKLYELYRRYGTRLRAEGITTLQRSIALHTKALVYGFDIPDVADNPLIWDVFGDLPLAGKLAAWESITDPAQEVEHLAERFGKDIFAVDGH
jgi:hypothetical protein